MLPLISEATGANAPSRPACSAVRGRARLPSMLLRHLIRWTALGLGVAAAAACSSADEQKAKDALQNEKRDTTITHEDCDFNSSDAQKVDANGDGKPDIIHVIKNGKEVCRVVDLNLDGKWDAFIYYDDQ